MAYMLIGYDVESPEDEVTTAFLKRAGSLHTSLGGPGYPFYLWTEPRKKPGRF